MSLPTVIVEVEDNEVSDTHVIGDQDVHVVVIDWDHIDCDPEEAKSLLEEMEDLPGTNVTEAIFTRLKDIIENNEEEEALFDNDDDDDEEEDEDDEEDEEDDDCCDICGEPGCEGECEDDDEEDDEVRDAHNNHGQGDDNDPYPSPARETYP